MAKKKKKENINLLKEMPYSLEAEKALLSAILVDNEIYNDVVNIIHDPNFFYTFTHKEIFRSMIELRKEGKQLDPINIGDELKKIEGEKPVEESEVGELFTPGVIHGTWENYASVIKEKYLYRTIIRECAKVIDESLDQEKLTVVIDHLFHNFNQISQSITSTREEYNLQNKLISFKNEIVEKIESGTFHPDIVTTGFEKLDKTVGGGLYPGSYNILGARASVGKTTFALNMIQNMARQGKKILFFSLEQPAEQLIARFLSMTLGVPFTTVMSGDMQILEDKYGDDVPKVINQAIETIGDYADKIIVLDDPRLDINDIKNITRRYVKEQGVEVVFIDYLQFIKAANRDTKLRETTDISRSLKELAAEEKVSLFVLSQLSRSIEQYDRKDKTPKLSDLRDSGALEQDADVVMFLYRPNEKVEGAEEQSTYHPTNEERRDILIAKNRNGATGKVPFLFFKPRFEFEETEPDW